MAFAAPSHPTVLVIVMTLVRIRRVYRVDSPSQSPTASEFLGPLRSEGFPIFLTSVPKFFVPRVSGGWFAIAIAEGGEVRHGELAGSGKLIGAATKGAGGARPTVARHHCSTTLPPTRCGGAPSIRGSAGHAQALSTPSDRKVVEINLVPDQMKLFDHASL